MLKASSAHTRHSLSRLFRRQRIERGSRLLEQDPGFGFLFLQALNNVRWRFPQKSFVAQLALCRGQTLLEFCDVFDQALAFGGDVDGALEDNGDEGAARLGPAKLSVLSRN